MANGERDDLPTIDEDTCLRDALSMMVTQRVSALTVLGTGGERAGHGVDGEPRALR